MMIPGQLVKATNPVTLTAITPVLVTRLLNPLANAELLSVFGDNYWHLTPAIFEAHAKAIGLNFADVPEQFRTTVKTYCWLLLNHQEPLRTPSGTNRARLSVLTILGYLRTLKPFFQWLDTRPAQHLNSLTADDFNAYLVTVLEAPYSMENRRRHITAVQRLWAYRTLLPIDGQLPTAPPWDGEAAGIVLGSVRTNDGENATVRIPEAVVQPLLRWSIRFVEDFSDDILAAHAEYRLLCNRNPRARRNGRSPSARDRGSKRTIREELHRLLGQYAISGRPVPGKRNAAGTLELHVGHICRQLDCNFGALSRHTEWLTVAVSRRSLALMDGAALHDRVTGQIDGAPWRSTLITYDESLKLARHLSTAAMIIIAYLSGMRPGEVLNLVRGCAVHDSVTGLDFVYGRWFKGARGADGAKLVEGAERRIPWTVIPLVVKAIAAVESLHSAQLLFPTSLQTNARVSKMRGQGKQARDSWVMALDTRDFIKWVNTYCDDHGRTDRIPPDPDGLAVTMARFRRTLAWFIWHRPRGAVAAALQYGHVHVRITQGYAGTAASGFPDDYAFEEFLGHYAQLVEDERRLREGEQVSGPAANVYRERTAQASQRFAGRIVPTRRQAQAGLNSPELQVFHGHAMTCVFDRTKALCELRELSDDPRRTPDLDNCRAACKNIARTDRDIQQMRLDLTALQADADDPLAPEPRRIRAATLAGRAQALIDSHVHEAQRATPTEEADARQK
jgi:integrase